MEKKISISIGDGSLGAFVAMPNALPAPVVLVLHEVFGVNNDMRESCRELAEHGFIALAPDLFWRQEPGLDLSQWSQAEWEKGLALYHAYDRDQGAKDIAAVMKFARSMQGSSGKVGVMGYCLGGLMTYLVSARYGSDASVAYYPGGADQYVAEAPYIAAPIIVHLAEEDEFIPKQAQASIRAAFAGSANAQTYSYAGQNHAFARHTGAHYDAEAAARANGRTWEFLRSQLM